MAKNNPLEGFFIETPPKEVINLINDHRRQELAKGDPMDRHPKQWFIMLDGVQSLAENELKGGEDESL